MASSAIYSAHPKYRLFVLTCAVLAVLFIWQLRQLFDIGAVLFLVIAVGLLLWYGRMMGSRVVVEETRMALHTPLARPKVVEFRQLAGVSEEGRIGQSILVLYHPLAEHGLVELDEVRSLALPAVQDQEALLATLAKQVPV